MRKELNLREIQLAEYRLMREAVEFFESENMGYFLSGGTLLGAVRHKGFIPWDDDIDLYLPRADYDRFEQLVRENKVNLKDAEVLIPGDANSPFPFIKVLDTNIHVDDHATIERFKNSVWVDVFPLDHWPDNQIAHRILLFWNMVLRGALVMETLREGMPKNKVFRGIAWGLNRVLGGYRNVIRLIDFNGRTMDRIFRNSSHLGNGVLPEGMKDWFTKESLQPLTKTMFEDREYNIPVNYDLYLTHFYGDYMTPPPEGQRARHHVTAWVDEEEPSVLTEEDNG